MEIDFSHIELRSHQPAGIHFMHSRGSAINADSMGLGKSLQALIASLKITDQFLIVGSKSSMRVWKPEIIKWFPYMEKDFINIVGSPAKRKLLWKSRHKIKFITYESLVRDIETKSADISWTLILLDEAHKIRNRQGKAFKALCKMDYDHIYPITGSPASKGPQDLWTMLHLIDRKFFSSYWKFVNTFVHVTDGMFGKELGGPKNPDQFRQLLAQYMIRRQKKDVPDLPDKLRIAMPLEMSDEQRRLYDELRAHKITKIVPEETDENGEYIVAPTSLSVDTKLRQCLVSPKLLDERFGYGAGIECIVDHIMDNEESIKRPIIFTPFPSAFPYLKEYMWKHMNKRKILTLRGGMSDKDVAAVIEEFNKDPNVIILCSIKFAQSFSLVLSNTAYFLGYEWDPQLNYQAEDRIHRLNSEHDVNLYYLKHAQSEDDHVGEIINGKVLNTTVVYETTNLSLVGQ